ncbi:MAG: hypothetical protein ACRDQZ_13185 [Mycobacteriales bacterium]
MPYASGSDLPAQFKKYTSHGKDAAAQAFNSALKEYDGDEGKAYAVAHSAAKKAESAASRKAKGTTKKRRPVASDNDEDD